MVTFSASGTVTFNLVEQGNTTLNGFAATSVVLTQTVVLAWNYQTTGSTPPPQSGTDTLTVQSLGTAVLDPQFWQGFAWYDPVGQLGHNHGLGLQSLNATSVTVSETGTESYTFTLGGLQTVSGRNNTPLANVSQTGQQSVNLTLAETFLFSEQGADTYTLGEQQGTAFPSGTTSLGSFSFNSVLYNETGNNSGGQRLGYAFGLSATGTVTLSGTATASGTQSSSSGGLGGNSQGSSQTQNYQINGLQTLQYGEQGSGVSYNLSQSGRTGAAGFALSAVAYNAQGSGNYSTVLGGLLTSTGSYGRSGYANAQQSAGVAGTLTDQARTSETGLFTQSAASLGTEFGGGTFTQADQGSYNTGQYTLATLVLTESASGTFALTGADSYTDSGNGTFSDIGTSTDSFTQNYGASNSVGGMLSQGYAIVEPYTSLDTASDTWSQGGSVGYGLTQTAASGGFAAYNLTCFVLSQSETGGTFGSTGTASGLQSGTGTDLESGTDTDTGGSSFGPNSGAGVGNDSFTSSATFSLLSYQSSNSSASGGFSLSSYGAGSYGPGGYSLSSVNLSQSQSDSWSGSSTDSSTYAGYQSSTQTGTSQASGTTVLGGASAAGLDSTSYSQTSLSTVTRSSTSSSSQSGTDSGSYLQQGSFAGYCFTFGTVVSQLSSTQDSTSTSSGADTLAVSGTSSFTSSANQSASGCYGFDTGSDLGTFVQSGVSTYGQSSSDSWTQTATSTAASSQYLAGSFAGGSYSFSSVNATQSGSDNWSSLLTGTSASSGSDSATSSGTTGQAGTSAYGGLASNGLGTSSYQQTATDTYAASGQQTVTQGGTDSASLSQQGTFGNLSYSFGSVVYSATSSQSGTTVLSGSSTYAGTVTSAGTVQVGQSSAATLGAVACNAGGALTQTAFSNFTQSGGDTLSQTATSSGSVTVYQAGSFAGGSYAFGSYAYTENDAATWSQQETQTAADSGSDSYTFSGSGNQGGALVQAAQSFGGLGTGSSLSTASDTFQDSSSSISVQSGTSSTSLTQLGSYANASFAFGTWVYLTGGSQGGTSTIFSSGSATSSGTDSFTSTGVQSAVSSYGITAFTGLGSTTAGASDTWFESDGQGSAQTLNYSSGFYLYQAGSMAFGSYGLSSVVYSTSATQSWTSLQTGSSTATGTDSSSDAGTLTQGVNGNFAGTYNSQGTVSYADSSNDTYADSSATTLTQAGNGSYSLSEQGVYNNDSFAFGSVIFQTGLSIGGTYQGSATNSSTSSGTSSLGTSGTWTNLFNAGPQANGGQQSYTTTDTQTNNTSELDTLTSSEYTSGGQSLYEAGSFAGGSFAFGSVTQAGSSTDCYTSSEYDGSTASGTDAASATNVLTASGTLTLNGSVVSSANANSTAVSSGSWMQSSTSTVTQYAFNSTTQTQQGSFSNGSYAFSSLIYQVQSNSLQTSLQCVTDSYTSQASDSYNSSGAESGSVGDGFGLASYSANGCYQQAGTDSATTSGADTTSATDYQSGTSTLYEAGSYVNGSYGLSSVAQAQSTADTWTLDQYSSSTQTGTDTSSGYLSSTSNNTLGASGVLNVQGSQYCYQSGSDSYVENAASTVQQAGTSGSSFSQQGVYGNYSFAFGSVLYQQTQGSTQTNTTSANDSYTARSNDSYNNSNTQSSSLANSIGGTWQGQTSLGSSGNDSSTTTGQDTQTSSDVASGTQSFYQAGCFSAGSYGLASAVYTSTASDSAAATLTSLATATGSTTQSGSNASNTSASSAYLGASGSGGGTSSYVQASNVTYTRSSNQTQTQSSTASSTFSEEGNYYGGNYAFGDVFYEVENTSNATALLSATNSFTETLSNGTTSSASGGGGLLQGYLSSTSQGTYGSGSGQSVNGGTLDCYTRSDYASNSSTLTEQGNFAAGSYALSSVVYDQQSADTYATLETLVSGQSANPSATQSYTPSLPSQQTIALGSGALTITSSAGGAGASSSNGSVTALETRITSFNSYATFALHETGTAVNG